MIQVSGTYQIFNKITERNFPKLKEDTPFQIQKAHKTSN